MGDSPHHTQRRRSNSRKLETPRRSSRRDAASHSRSCLRSPLRDRSRSQLRTRSRVSCDPDLERERQRVKALEVQLLRERERLLRAEERRLSTTRREREDHRGSSPGGYSVRPVTSSRCRDTCQRNSLRGLANADAERRSDVGCVTRSRSPSITKKQFIDVFNCLKDSLTSQPSAGIRSTAKIDYMNILPNFDPSQKNQRVDVWLKKVNECASVYGWDDRTTTHFAMQKLQGLARIWYEGLNSVLFSWQEWQDKLVNAFPFEQNYGQALEDMLKRKSRFNEPIEVYFYEKLTLLNQCDIVGKRAVECLIHGISDRTLRTGALALRCTQPDQLLQYLMCSRDSYNSVDRNQSRNKTDGTYNNNYFNHKPINRPSQTSSCYNCKEKGHSFLHCPKPLIKCNKCYLLGHLAENCTGLTKTDKAPKPNTVQKTMCIDCPAQQQNDSSRGSKFLKNVVIKNIPFEAFVDFGSDVTLLKESVVRILGLTHDNVQTCLKGFGNSVVQTIGGLALVLSIDGVEATVPCRVVHDSFLEKPVLIGQSYTEQAHIIVYKDATKLQFIDIGKELPTSDLEIAVESPLPIRTTDIVELYGPASVRAKIERDFTGTILLRSVVAGEPHKKYLICGGLCSPKNGRLTVTVFPHGSSCRISGDTVLCRAEKVNVINRVIVEPTEIAATMNRELDECQIRVDDSVSDKIKSNLFAILNKYAHCFTNSLQNLGCTNAAEMNIELSSERPIVYRPYRLSYHEREKVRDMIKEMLDAGIVRESVSQYASPILLVRKKDGSFRLCIDYRMLNSITVKERYPMPIIEDEIARLSGQTCFITLDLASGYYQVPISEQSKHLTSFVTPDGQYEFNRMPFGLANAPAVFQRMINSILGAARFNKATAYIDDILIFAKDATECLLRLEEVLRLIEKANLTLNLSKCEFLRNKIDYLGYEISEAGVRPGEKKILSVINFPRPQNVHNIRQFLGLASYFRKFIKGFASTASPLSKLLKKDMTWEWGIEQEEAFQTLKTCLIDRPILVIYNPDADTELHTDASRLGVGGILLQRHSKSDDFRPVAYYSRQTSPEEKNFHSYELETLAVVCSLQKFRVFLLGKQFKIVTDCSALRSTFTKRDLIPRIARWWLLLQEFNCSVEYRAGAKMSHVDALSRNAIYDNETLTDQFPAVMAITGNDWLHTLQLGDGELRRICSILSSDLDDKGLQYIKDNYVLKDNKLYRYIDGDKNNLRWVVPKGARWQLCRFNHDDIGHFGVEKTLERMKKSYWFAKMSRFVKKYVNSCIECAFAKNNSKNREGLLHPITKVEHPFHTVHVDHLGPFVKSRRGFTHLLVVVDGFTKFCVIKPVRNTNTENTIRALEDILCTFRNPERLISDRGSCFTSHKFKTFCNEKGIKHILNAVASPRSNGQVERYNRTILDSMRAMAVKHGEKYWDSHIGTIQWGLNNTIQKTIGKTPSEVLFGTCMNGEKNPILSDITSEQVRDNCNISEMREEVKGRINSEQLKQKRAYDKNRKPARTYSVGDLVKITKTYFHNDGQSKKLMPIYVGPYRVAELLGRDRYKLAPIPGMSNSQNRRSTTVAADRMKPWIHISALELNEHDSDHDCNSDNSSLTNG